MFQNAFRLRGGAPQRGREVLSLSKKNLDKNHKGLLFYFTIFFIILKKKRSTSQKRIRNKQVSFSRINKSTRSQLIVFSEQFK